MHLILLAHNHIFFNTSTFTLEFKKSLLLAHSNERFKSRLLGCQGPVAVCLERVVELLSVVVEE
jgi:hypothetical protein